MGQINHILTQFSVDGVCNMLTQTWMVKFFVLTILSVALIPFYQSIFSIRKVNKDLNNATTVLNELGKERQHEEFYARFEAINSRILEITGLKHAWREFVDSMYFGNESLNNKKAYLSHRPSYYFNRDSVLGTRLNLPQFLAYPNYLIGIGLTFTFIGLAAALHVAQGGLANGGGQQALKDLLAVASIKFISSIAGILSSLVLSFLQRWRIKNFQERLAAFCDLLEECTEYKSAEKLLHENFQEQQKHTMALNDMATNIATGIGDVLSNQLPSSVANALEPLAHEIRALAQKFSGSNENALEKVLQEFLAQLRKSSADDMQGLIDSVKTLKGSLDGLVVNMQSMGETFGSDTKESTARLASMLETFVTSFAPVQQGIGQFGQALASLEIIASKIEQAGGSISGAADISNKSMSQLAGTVTDISGNLAPMQELLANLSLSLNKVDETALHLKSAGGTIAMAADGFKNSAASIEQAEGRFNQKVQIFESVADGISGTIAVLERASGQVSNAAQPLSEVSVGITKALQVMQETEMRIQRNQQELNSMLLGLQKFSETIPNLWKQYEDRFNKVDGDLGKAFNELAQGSEQFRSSIGEFVTLLDEHFSSAIKDLSGAINELAEEREQSTFQNKTSAA
jgi:chromosome segregation ATPase